MNNKKHALDFVAWLVQELSRSRTIADLSQPCLTYHLTYPLPLHFLQVAKVIEKTMDSQDTKDSCFSPLLP